MEIMQCQRQRTSPSMMQRTTMMCRCCIMSVILCCLLVTTLVTTSITTALPADIMINNNGSSGSQKDTLEPHQKLRAEGQQPQSKYDSRLLANIRHDGNCHEDMLISSPLLPSTTLTSVATSGNNSTNFTSQQAMGYIFSVKNNGTSIKTISALSVHLQTKLEFNYTIYVMDGSYVTKNSTGGIIDTTLGKTLNGTGVWSEITRGINVTIGDFTKDEDGASLLPFTSSFNSGGGGNADTSVDVDVGEIKSFYIKFTEIIMAIGPYELEDRVGKGESIDMSATVTEGYDGMLIYVGRTVSTWGWYPCFALLF